MIGTKVELAILFLILLIIYPFVWMHTRDSRHESLKAIARSALWKIGKFVFILITCSVITLGNFPVGIALVALAYGALYLRKWLKRKRKIREQQAKDRQSEADRIQSEVEQEQRRALKEQTHQRLFEARCKCDLFYSVHSKEIEKRLPRKHFIYYLDCYLGEDCPSRLIDTKAAELIALIEGHLAKLGLKQRASLGSLIDWYEQTKRDVETKNLDPEVEEAILTGIDEQFARRQEEFIRNMKP